MKKYRVTVEMQGGHWTAAIEAESAREAARIGRELAPEPDLGGWARELVETPEGPELGEEGWSWP